MPPARPGISVVEWTAVILAGVFAVGVAAACWIWLGDFLSIPSPG